MFWQTISKKSRTKYVCLIKDKKKKRFSNFILTLFYQFYHSRQCVNRSLFDSFQPVAEQMAFVCYMLPAHFINR